MTQQPFSPFEAPALIVTPGISSLLTPDGEMLTLPNKELTPLLKDFPPPLLVHGPEALRLLNLPPEPQPVPWFDLLELFLFIHPARTVTPTPRGLALTLGLMDEHDDKTLRPDQLYKITRHLLEQLSALGASPKERASLLPLLDLMKKAGWVWANNARTALLSEPLRTELRDGPEVLTPFERLKIWKNLPQWEEKAPRSQPGTQPVTPLAARKRLAEILGPDAETRTGQADFSSVTSYAFLPREKPGAPHLVLAEAGTGTGKTLGYIAPASLWAEMNAGTVWISTYTRHLQRQIEQELTRLYPDPILRRDKIVIRKGRENYLCLLNLEDITIATLNRPATNNPTLIALALLARWAEKTADGDLQGGDLPGWFGDLFGTGLLAGIADRRGECIHGACGHYQSCFIENSIRKARHADLVIANHALTLSQAAWNALVPQSLAPADLTDENGVPTHIIFDEGHHIFDASDNAFALSFSGLETAELRRWILGNEGGRSRARGLYRRMDDLLELFPPLKDMLQKILLATQLALPQPQWSLRLQEARELRLALQQENTPETEYVPPDNPSEHFLQELDALLEARLAENRHPHEPDTRYGRQEADLYPVTDTLLTATDSLIEALQKIVTPLDRLIAWLAHQLEDNTELDPTMTQRLEALIRSLYRRALTPLQGWIAMLRAISVSPEAGKAPVFVDFIQRDRFSAPRMGIEGLDIGLHRHWLDPTLPFADTLRQTAHGLLVTSATLRDQQASTNEEESWQKAEQRVGIPHFLKAPIRASLLSPFDYGKQTRAYIITDVSAGIISLSRTFQALFETSQGGALGLFTAINRLKAVYKQIQAPLSQHNLTLYAQHMDIMDNATLVDIFRTERHSCLLGTDSMRDGVDVPGDALRMVVFERTPWPRPDILHRERRRYLSNDNPHDYDDFITRMRLRQAFGRLIRRKDDKGVFVMLDRRLPTRLLSAFPHGVEIKRLKLAEALPEIAEFLEPEASRES